MIKAGIIGATGYAGAELARLLARHPKVEISGVVSKSYVGERFSSIYGNMFTILDRDCTGEDLAKLAQKVDVVFTATPQGFLSQCLTSAILEEARIIDLSADFRLSDVSVYEKWYKIKHGSPELLEEAVYGLCELYREDIRETRLVANPGCYTTCSILAAWPLVKNGLIDPKTLIFDAKSGTSGAGRGAKTANLFCEVNENIKAYGVATHRHTPEIEQELSIAAGEEIRINFTPHLVPMNRGILITAYATCQEGISAEDIRAAYEKCYGEEYFIRLLPEDVCPETKWVEGSNFVDIGFCLDERTGRVILMSALDNLVKGAAGQAVQNMNLMFGFDEKEGLDGVPFFP
ncbi:MAG: N-acetyl-gamma-glutamyl-phosphate reductase [Lachnospiraceae bacterium]|nr:N-acetyl-gamma-glutamyl-phosphate reductase [Lachnospiraceae bacterium]